MGVVIGSSPRTAPGRQGRRGPWRWLPRSGGALLASAAFHAVAAVTVGGVLAVGTRGGARPAEMVELELAPAAELATNVPMPAAAPPVAAPSEPVRAHPSPRRRIAMPTPAAPSVEPIATPVTDAPVSPHFAMSAGTVATRATVVPSSSRGTSALAASAGEPGAAAGTGAVATTAFGEGDVNEPARLLSSGQLVYPAAARAASIEVDFPVEIVVDTSGHVVAARALRRAGYGLDEAALRAIHDYRFSPAVRAGRAVPVRMRWTVQFRLR